MKDFMKKFEEHPIKEVAVFIGGVLTGAALTMNDNSVLSEKEKENIFIKRSSETEDKKQEDK